jgi:hypothetical protein
VEVKLTLFLVISLKKALSFLFFAGVLPVFLHLSDIHSLNYHQIACKELVFQAFSIIVSATSRSPIQKKQTSFVQSALLFCSSSTCQSSINFC